MTVTQADFQAAILDPDRAVPGGLVDPQGRIAGKRFDVYRNNVVVSLSNALGEAFPVIKKLLGDNNFNILAGQFVRQHPPSSPVIALYGDEMPGFLETFEPVQSLGYLPDVARLELALRQAYHAADATAFDATILQDLPPDRLLSARFTLAPAFRMIVSDWPIVSIWRFNSEDGPKPSMRAETALITRPDLDPTVADLSPAGGAMVAALANRDTFGDAMEAATAQDPDFDLTETLSALIAGGAIIAITEEPLK